jgi:3-methyladenine DNA glycosylase AlkD
MTVEQLVQEIRSDLAARIDPEFREGMLNFFREPIDAWGVRSPEVKRISRDAFRAVKPWPRERREEFAAQLWESGRIEECAIAIAVYRRFQKSFGRHEFRLFEGWIDRYVHNWANCDGVSSWLIAAAIANEPGLIARLPAWTRSRNRWKRRSAIVSLLQEAKQGRHTREALDIAAALLGDTDDMVLKGVGWVLKEAYPKRPREVVEFLAASGAPRLVLRIAAEKMTERARELVLRRESPPETKAPGIRRGRPISDP